MMPRLHLLYGLEVFGEIRLLRVPEEGRRSGVPVVVQVQPSPRQWVSSQLDPGGRRRLGQGRGGDGASHPREGREDLGEVRWERPSQLGWRKVPCSVLLLLQVSQTCSAAELSVLVEGAVPALTCDASQLTRL